VKTYYSTEDIEMLAGQGVRELVVDDNTVLTSVAREAAARLGIKLVAPGQGAPQRGSAAAAPAVAATVSPSKPRGCQHGPLVNGQSQGGVTNRGNTGSAVVSDLIGAVKQLVRQG
jgi:hypothetical protein